jgi:hypothetical protein
VANWLGEDYRRRDLLQNTFCKRGIPWRGETVGIVVGTKLYIYFIACNSHIVNIARHVVHKIPHL